MSRYCLRWGPPAQADRKGKLRGCAWKQLYFEVGADRAPGPPHSKCYAAFSIAMEIFCFWYSSTCLVTKCSQWFVASLGTEPFKWSSRWHGYVITFAERVDETFSATFRACGCVELCFLCTCSETRRTWRILSATRQLSSENITFKCKLQSGVKRQYRHR